jgi:hypothetical protein
VGWPNSKDILPSCSPKYNRYSGRKMPMGKLRCRWDNDAWKDTVDLFQKKNQKAVARGIKDWRCHGLKQAEMP